MKLLITDTFEVNRYQCNIGALIMYIVIISIKIDYSTRDVSVLESNTAHGVISV